VELARVDRPTVITLGRDVCRDLSRALSLEWLVADGRGGYACGTVAGAATRRYHALYTVAEGPSLARTVLLARVEEEVEIGGERVALSTNLYPGAVHPRGYERIVSFAPRPLPTWRFEIPGGEVERAVCLDRESGALVLRWRLLDVPEARLRVRPILGFRDHHGTGGQEPRATTNGPATRFFREGAPDLHLRADPPAQLSGDSWWYRRYEYPVERARGLEWSEDLPSPGAFTLPLRQGEPTFLVASDRLVPHLEPRAAFAREERARSEGLGRPGSFVHDLSLAALDFPIEAPGGRRSIVAGYPWFADWGRDALVALPGILLARGKTEDAIEVLRSFASAMEGGLVPNRFTEAREGPIADHASADASLLWAVVAADLARTSEDAGFRRETIRALLGIVEAYERGTSFGVRVEDGLVRQGTADRPLTWMDARVEGTPVTPRTGAAVELTALYYRALRSGAALLAREGRLASHRFEALARRTRSAFGAFFLEEGLADVVGDPSSRPNQLFALGGEFPVLDPSDPHARGALSRVRAVLLVPRGLRTLDPADPRYRGRYEGNVSSRDRAYHQGSVWPWLIGVYADAAIAIDGERGADEVRGVLEGFAPHLREACLGQVSELFDGDAPHAPGGAFAQAWSVGELLRIATRLA
jgi:predicted glycogen debranching enzyme